MTAEIAEVVGADVSRETLYRLETHKALLTKWNPAINLVAPRTLDTAWTRHILDSAQVFAANEAKTGLWLDLGSGGGFPGLVCAILAADLRPKLRFSLVESDGRKCAFLTTVARETGIDLTILPARIESLPPQGAAVVSARALAPLDRLLALATPHLAAGGTGLFPKGARHRQEIDEARRSWRFKLTTKPSITDPEAVILVVGEIERA